MDKPPWELHLLQESGTKTDSVAVLRVHQSVADGPALLKLLCSCLSDTRIMSRARVNKEWKVLDRYFSLTFCSYRSILFFIVDICVHF